MIGNTSYWEKTTYLSPYDFAIIGGGFTGRYIALELNQKFPKAKIAIIERSPVSAGASTRNAGFATFGNVSETIEDLKKMSELETTELISDRFKGLQFIQNNFSKRNFEFKITGGWEIFTNQEELDIASENLLNINKIMWEATGIKDLFKLNKTQKLGFKDLKMGIQNNYEGFLHPALLLHEIQLKLKNTTFLNGIEITKIIGNTLLSKEGYEIYAKQIFVANNSFLPLLYNQYKTSIFPARGQIIVTDPIQHKIPEGIYHCDKGYIYFRTLGERILIGGGRNKFKEAETTYNIEENTAITQYLQSFLVEIILPKIKINIAYKWSGIMAMGESKNPIIEKINDNTIVCSRMGGIGVALSPIAAQKAVSLL